MTSFGSARSHFVSLANSRLNLVLGAPEPCRRERATRFIGLRAQVAQSRFAVSDYLQFA